MNSFLFSGDFIIAQDAHLSIDRINDETLEDLTSQVWYQDTNVAVTHRQWFDDVVIEGNVLSNVRTSHRVSFNLKLHFNRFLLQAVVNNVNLSDLNRRYVSTSSPNELTALYEFDSLHIRNGLFVDFLNATSVNDLETNHFKDSVLLRSREQDLSNNITFESFQTKSEPFQFHINSTLIPPSNYYQTLCHRYLSHWHGQRCRRERKCHPQRQIEHHRSQKDVLQSKSGRKHGTMPDVPCRRSRCIAVGFKRRVTTRQRDSFVTSGPRYCHLRQPALAAGENEWHCRQKGQLDDAERRPERSRTRLLLLLLEAASRACRPPHHSR